MTLEKGKTYQVRLTSGKWVTAEFLAEQTSGGYRAHDTFMREARTIRKKTRYHFRNLASGRDITLRSMRKVKAIEGAL